MVNKITFTVMPTYLTWPAADETEPYPWATVPCPDCGETELAGARGFRPVDFVCMACGYLTQIVTNVEVRP